MKSTRITTYLRASLACRRCSVTLKGGMRNAANYLEQYEAYIGKHVMSKDFDYICIESFFNYMRLNYDLRHNTVVKITQTIVAAVNRMRKGGMLVGRDYEDFRLREEERRNSSEEHCATSPSVSAALQINYSSRAVTLRPYHTSAPCRLRASAWGFFVGRLDGWTGKFPRRSRKTLKLPLESKDIRVCFSCPLLCIYLSYRYAGVSCLVAHGDSGNILVKHVRHAGILERIKLIVLRELKLATHLQPFVSKSFFTSSVPPRHEFIREDIIAIRIVVYLQVYHHIDHNVRERCDLLFPILCDLSTY